LNGHSLRLRTLIEDHGRHQEVAVSLADKVAGKHEDDVPDLRGPDASDSTWLQVVYQNGQKCIVAPTSVIVNEYLPGEENEQLRKSFVSRLDDIEKVPVRQCMATSMRS
jgi:hypothetical protein